MKVYSISEARKNIGKLIQQVVKSGEPLFISKHGKIVAVIMPYDDENECIVPEKCNKGK